MAIMCFSWKCARQLKLQLIFWMQNVMVVSIHWTGLLDWNTGLAFDPQNRHLASYSLVGQVLLNIVLSLTYFSTVVASAAGAYAYMYA